MAKHWLVKSDPDHYSFDDLVRDGKAAWDGVTNTTALIHIRAMRKGDDVIVYASGDVKAAVGLATVARDPYPDPKVGDPKIVIVDISAKKALPRPVTLAEIKADPAFRDCDLVRISRLSVMPLTDAHWRRLLAQASK
ncbi:MAG: EVE domain-containing protein [Planctomycetes bacterium]|nr:EVE domain-containing protein [Planctomycetota bacterium]MBI3843272.1 EVE domain-containing protein [Planctomycetota bacterium]